MRKYVLCPLAALALGCGGAALRMCRPEGLSPLLIVLCVGGAALFAFSAFRCKDCRPGAFFTRVSPLSPMLLLVAACLFGVAAMLRLVMIQQNKAVLRMDLLQAASYGVIRFLTGQHWKRIIFPGASRESDIPAVPIMYCG